MALVNVGTSTEAASVVAENICKIIRTAAECHCVDSVQLRALDVFGGSIKVEDVTFDRCTFSTGNPDIGN